MKNICKWLLTGILVTTTLMVNAQDRKFSFGLHVSPNLSWLKPEVDNEVYKSEGSGVHFGYGADFNYFFIDNIGMGIGLNFAYAGGKLKFHSQDNVMINDTSRTLQGIMLRKYRLQYLEIPIVLIGQTGDWLGKFSIYAKFGLGSSFKIRARADDEFTPDNSQSTFTSKDRNISSSVSFWRESVIIGVGVTYRFAKVAGINAGITFNNGFTDILTGTNPANPEVKEKARLNYVTLDIGVVF